MLENQPSGKWFEHWLQLPRAWFYLTPSERLAVAVILSLLLLGLGARCWYLSRERPEIVPPPVNDNCR